MWIKQVMQLLRYGGRLSPMLRAPYRLWRVVMQMAREGAGELLDCHGRYRSAMVRSCVRNTRTIALKG